jgi:oxygen-dependent protoporphyrinogen oxidase
MARVVIVGGGIAGAAAAWFLREHQVTVIDGAAQVGGKLRTSDVAGLSIDEGAEQLLVRRPEAVALAREVGLGDELVNPQTSSASVWARGRLRPLELARVLPGAAPTEDVSVASFVGHRVGRPVVDRLVEPLLGGVYAGRADLLSLFATMPQLPRVDGSLMVAVRRALPTSSNEPVFATVRGGLMRLVDAVIDRSRAEVVTSRLVRRLERTSSGWRVIHGATVDERATEADAVVLAVPAQPAARLLADCAPVAASELAAIDYASVAIITLAYPAASMPPLVGSGYLVPAQPGRPVKAVTFTSSKWSHLHGDVAVVRASIGRYGDVDELQRDDEDLVTAVRRELATTVGIHAEPVATRVSRWGGGLPQYTVGHLDRVQRIRSVVAAVHGLAVCGAAYDGIGVPACIASARRAVDTLLPQLSDQPS